MDSLKAKDEFHLFPKSKSSKEQGYKNGVRPNHYIPKLNCSVIGVVNFESVDEIQTWRDKNRLN